jgi:hypothetical protein
MHGLSFVLEGNLFAPRYPVLYLIDSRPAHGVNTPWLFRIYPAHHCRLTSIILKARQVKTFDGNE